MQFDLEVVNNFKNRVNYDESLKNRKAVPDTKATYVLWCNTPLGRLIGQSHVLYIGSTNMLGGKSDSCRLYGYKYPSTPQERTMQKSIEILTKLGRQIELRWCEKPPRNLDVKQYESELLKKALENHLELPPLNRKG